MEFDARNIPVIGGDIGQVGRAYRIWSQPCTPHPWIAVMAFWTYFPTLIWSLLAPDPLDMAFDRAGRRHKRIRGGRIRATDVMQIPGPSKPGPALAFFNMARLGQRVGWYFIIADATSDFLINWTSMAYAWSGCRVDSVSWAKMEGTDVYQGGFFNGGTMQMAGDTHERHGFAGSSTSEVYVSAPGPKTFHGGIVPRWDERYIPRGEILRVFFRKYQGSLPTKIIEATESVDDLGRTRYDAVQNDYFHPDAGVRYRGFIQVTQGAIYADSVSMHLTGAPPHGITPSSDLGHLSGLG